MHYVQLAVAERLNSQAEGSKFSWYIFHPSLPSQAAKPLKGVLTKHRKCLILLIYSPPISLFFSERCPPPSEIRREVRVLEMTDAVPAQCEYTVIYWAAGTHQHKHLSYGNLVCPSEFFLFHLASFLRPLPAAGVSAIMMTPFHKKEAGCQKQEHALRP